MRRTDPERNPRDGHGPAHRGENHGPADSPEHRDPVPRGEKYGPVHGGDAPDPVARGEDDGPVHGRDGHGPAHRAEDQGPADSPEERAPAGARENRGPVSREESCGPVNGGDAPDPVARGGDDGPVHGRDGQGPAHRRDGHGPVRRREDHGPVRYGPPLPADGLPVLPELSAVLAAAADRADAQPVGGAPALLEAACGYWTRRGLPCVPDRIAAGPGAPALLLAITAALAGEGADILVPRPCAAWWAPYARLLGRPVFHVPTPAESGGVPDPYALLETVRRVRAEGGDPRLLVLSVADDPTATVAPPELLHETVEAATAEGLHLVSDETWRDTLHAPHETVLLSPAEMWPDEVTVVTDLAGALLPAGWPAAVARFPATAAGRRLHARVLDVLTALGARLAAPVAAAACYALDEPPPVTERREATVRLHARVAAAAYSAVVAAGALARPPQAGRHLYADLAPLREPLAARGVGDAQELEDLLTARLGMPAPGGHRFGDDLGALRVRLATGPLLGGTDEERTESLASPAPLELPHVRGALVSLKSAFDDLRDDAQRWEAPR